MPDDAKKKSNVHDIPWEDEPDIDQVRRLHTLLSADPTNALPQLEALGRQGSLASALYLGDYYYKSRNSKSDFIDRAIYWYSKARDRDYLFASYMTGKIHQDRQAYQLAMSSFSVGADRGYLPCIYCVAKLHQAGNGVPKNLRECRRLLQIAKDGGHIYAKRDLAGLMLTGTYGPTAVPRGALMLSSLWSDLGFLMMKGIRSESILDERVLA